MIIKQKKGIITEIKRLIKKEDEYKKRVKERKQQFQDFPELAIHPMNIIERYDEILYEWAQMQQLCKKIEKEFNLPLGTPPEALLRCLGVYPYRRSRKNGNSNRKRL